MRLRRTPEAAGRNTVTVGFQISADIERGASYHPCLVEEKGNQHAAQAAVAVKKGVQRLELGVDDGKLNKSVRRLLVQLLFPSAHSFRQLFR
jgi:hypothetical protein